MASAPTYSPHVAGDDASTTSASARSDLPDGTSIALLSGDPGRSELIAATHLGGGRALARNRGLDSFLATLPGGAPVVCATSGMGAPSMSIVVNELVQVGITTVIRIGTAGSIQDHVRAGEVVIGSGALTNQGAAPTTSPRPSSRPSPTRSSP